MKKEKGFTLTEILIVVLIIGLLVGMGLPRLIGIIDKARESSTRDNLKQLRTAIQNYYDVHDTFPTSTITEVLVPRYINTIPEAKLRRTAGNTLEAGYKGNIDSAQIWFGNWFNDTQQTNRGGWLYDANRNSEHFGEIWVNASTFSFDGTLYSSW
jgi:prepilin-type N-terminal cleavage/methylation domain-containing protein